MHALEREDIQGLLLRGYGQLPHAHFCHITFGENIKEVRAAIAKLLPLITPGNVKPETSAVNIAFTCVGLKKIGLTSKTLMGFSQAFALGMHDKNKSRALGDIGANAPENWDWGGKSSNTPDIALMFYAKDEKALNDLKNKPEIQTLMGAANKIWEKDSTFLFENKEHFGFRDGIAQPKIKGLGKVTKGPNVLPPGEFILGYKNIYTLYPPTPPVHLIDDAQDHLLVHPENPNYKDFGRNGSFMVFRQLEQDVKKFWDFMVAQGDGLRQGKNLAEKMIGRKLHGEPLTPQTSNPIDGYNHFDYSQDAQGIHCPLGSHIRRANPRESVFPRTNSRVTDPYTHRILRRGRPYGAPMEQTLDPQKMLDTKSDKEKGDRGLLFICFNTDIERQFEFIQQSWLMSLKFAGLRNEMDPLMNNGAAKNYTIQDTPIRRAQVKGIPQFVTTKGGTYFFLPSIRALRYLASLG